MRSSKSGDPATIVLLAAIASLQGMAWSTFSAAAEDSKVLFGCGDLTIALLGYAGPVGYLVALPAASWMLDP